MVQSGQENQGKKGEAKMEQQQERRLTTWGRALHWSLNVVAIGFLTMVVGPAVGAPRIVVILAAGAALISLMIAALTVGKMLRMIEYMILFED